MLDQLVIPVGERKARPMPENPSARVIVQQWVSLDGFASGPNDETDIMATVDAEADARSQEYNQNFLSGASAVLLGSRTYRKFVEYWPTADEPIAARVNGMRKVVASATLSSAPWGDHEPAIVVDDAVTYARQFRSEESGALVVWGSLDLTRSLMDAAQVDELDLFVAPVWLGSGTALLGTGQESRLRQVLSEDWGTITHLRYRLGG